jgi:beta-lactamase regulating signal transducer with metallopeptidase domain
MGGFAAAGTLGLVAEYFLKTTAVLTLALLAAAASRRRPAAFRHFVLSFALIGLLLLPVLTLAPVGWRTSFLPARPAGTGTGTPALIPARPGATGARAAGPDAQSPPPGIVRFPELPLTSTAGGPAGAATGLSRPGATARSPEFSSPPLSGAATSRLPAAGTDPINSILAVLWAAGLVVLFLRLAVGLAGAVKLTAQGTALADPAWRVLLERFRALVSLRRYIRLRSHPEVLMPLTWGWRKPVVLMPAGADAWTEEQRSSALFHELSHVKRADFLVMLLVRTSLAAFWFNPLCWVVYRELRKEQEIACDELVLRAGIRPSTYAASLLAFRRSAGFRWNPSAALLGMLGRSSFHERLAAILKQKLTFKEVKMKTKIMLASAVVLAVALVGTARPAAGIEKTAATTAVVETAAPAPVSLAVVLPVSGAQEMQAEKAVVQEKEKKKIVVTTKDGAKTPIEITITEGDQVKTLVLDKPLTITSGKDGHVLVLTSEGKEIQVLEGEPLRLEIRGGEIELIKEGQALKVGEGGAYKIIREGDKEGSKIVYYWTPEGKTAGAQEIRIIKEGKADEATAEVFIKRMKDKKEGETWVAVEPAKEATVVKEGPGGVKVVVKTVTEAEPEITWMAKEAGKEGAVWVTKEFSEKPVEGAWVREGGKAFAISPVRDKELLEKVRAIREQVAAVKAKKMDIDVLQKSLEKLEAELAAKAEKINELKMKFEKEPAGITVVEKIREEKARSDKAEGMTTTWVAKADEADEAKAVTKVIAKDDNTIQIVSGTKGMGPEDYERAVAKLKKELPEGYKLLEQKFDAKNGTMHFKIAPPEGTKADEKIIQKIVELLRPDTKKR